MGEHRPGVLVEERGEGLTVAERILLAGQRRLHAVLVSASAERFPGIFAVPYQRPRRPVSGDGRRRWPVPGSARAAAPVVRQPTGTPPPEVGRTRSSGGRTRPAVRSRAG